MFYRHWRILLHVSLFAIASSSNSSIANEGFNLTGTLFERIGAEKNIDPLLLYSVAIVESAAGKGNGLIAPTPLVIRHSGRAYYFSSKEEAKNKLREVLKQTKNVDVGLMQINLKHHPHETPSDLFDPEENLRKAADILNFAMASTNDKALGIGRYHNWKDVERSMWYGEAVLRVYSNLSNFKKNN